VRRLSNVRIVDGAKVEGITLSGQGSSTQMRSVEIQRGQNRESITGDVFVDCLGRRSSVLGWLRDHGRNGKHESHNSQTWYFSRHYRLHDGAKPQLDEQSGDMDFLRFAIVYGETGHFAIGLSVDDSDAQLTQLVRRPEGFERVCRTIPQVRDWVTNAQPLTKVLGFGDIENRWVDATQRGRPLALGLLHAGDSARETNPFYGKGCTAALVSAHLVADVLHHTRDPGERGRLYDFSVATDRMFRARSLATRGGRVPLAHRLIGHAYLTLVVPAAFEDAQVARTLLGIQHMRSPSSLQARLALAARMLYLALRRLPRRARAPKLLLPQRSEFVAPLADSQATLAADVLESALPVPSDSTNG
jgi:2-polyprenyl-6-methoxyphenol hydroxylase-like FAD-dependent oxidoreductase